MSRFWTEELWRLGLGLLATLVAWVLFGEFFLFATLFLGLYVVRLLLRLRALERWLSGGARRDPPEATGIWGEIFHQIYLLQRRSLKRQRKLTAVVNRFQEATSAMPDAAVVLGSNDEIQWFNDAAGLLLGLNWASDRGQRIDNLVRFPGFIEFLRHHKAGESVLMPSADQGGTLSVRIVPYGNDQQLLIARDVSQQQRLDQMRQDFVANVSHELRTPLTVVSGCAETLIEDCDEHTEGWRRPLTLIQQQSARMLNIIQDLLLLSTLETDRSGPPREPVAVAAMLASITEDARILSGEKGHTIRLEADPELDIYGVESQLHSAFNNLVSNAVRYTPKGGEITLRWYCDEQGAHFEVSDTGPGIPEEHIPRLTERFYRVDVGRSRQSGGTGLGLAIVKHVLSRYRSQLRVESACGHGSTFACDFSPDWVVPAAGEAPQVARGGHTPPVRA